MSSSSTNLFKKARNLEIAPAFQGYTGVRIHTGRQDENKNEIVFESQPWDETGRILEISNEWGTQTQANNILKQIQNWSYKPFTADGAILDPAAELNDGVTVNGVYSGICRKNTSFGKLMESDISAPTDEELDHEYSYQSPSERKFVRELRETRAELKIQASQISAKVASSGGKSSSFGWVLTDSDWALYSDGNEIFKVTSDQMTFKVGNSILLECGNLSGGGTGLRVNGLIEAREFRTAAGDTLATTEQLNSIRTSAYGGSYGNGFLASLGSGLNFNHMDIFGKSQGGYTADWLVANHIFCYWDGINQTISGLHYGGWLDDNNKWHFVYWRKKTFATDVSGDAWGTSFVWVEGSDGNAKMVPEDVAGSAWVSDDDEIEYLGS